LIAFRQPIAGEDVARHYDALDAFYRDIWGEHVHHGLWLRGDETLEVAVRQLTELVAREAAIGRGTRVIDIGCGYGATARLLAEACGAHVTAITISAAQHAIAVEKTSSPSCTAAEVEGKVKTRETEESTHGNHSAEPRMDADERGLAEAASSSAPIRVHPRLISSPHPRYLLGDWLQNDLPGATFDAAIAIESSEHMPDKPRFFAEAARVLRPGGHLVICAWLAAEAPTPGQRRHLIEPICRESRMPHLGSESDYRALATAAGFTLERFQDVTRQISRTWPNIIRTFLLKLLHRPGYARFLLGPHAPNRIFALTTLRLWLAFRTGAMRYAVFTLRQ